MEGCRVSAGPFFKMGPCCSGLVSCLEEKIMKIKFIFMELLGYAQHRAVLDLGLRCLSSQCTPGSSTRISPISPGRRCGLGKLSHTAKWQGEV